MEGRRIIGPSKDILEVKNAIDVYKNLNLCGLKVESFLAAHRELMQGLISDNGRWRNGGVGIHKGDKIVHMAPPASRVEGLNNLFHYIMIKILG